MTGNRAYLTDYEEIDGGFVAFGENSKGGKISGKGKIRTGKLDFEDVYFVKKLSLNLNKDFKLTDESHVLLKIPRKDNISKDSPDAGFKPSRDEEKKDVEDQGNESGNPTKEKDSGVSSTEEPRINQDKDDYINNTNNINTASDGNSTGSEVYVVDPKTSIELPNDPNMPKLKDIVYSDDDEDVGAEADINNLDTHIPVSPIPTTRIHKDLPVKQII
ncbi:hypothetical protein Tco_0569792 [Tanacetum coccineum]